MYYPDETKEENLLNNDQNLQKGQVVIENGSFSYDNIDLQKHNLKT